MKNLYVYWREDCAHRVEHSMMCGTWQEPLATVSMLMANSKKTYYHLFFPTHGIKASASTKSIDDLKKEVEEKFLRYMSYILQEEVTCDDIPF